MTDRTLEKVSKPTARATGITLVVVAGVPYAEVYRGTVTAIPREGESLEIDGHPNLIVSTVIWALPKRGQKETVMIYAK